MQHTFIVAVIAIAILLLGNLHVLAGLATLPMPPTASVVPVKILEVRVFLELG
jgi:hypothetical protein